MKKKDRISSLADGCHGGLRYVVALAVIAVAAGLRVWPLGPLE